MPILIYVLAAIFAAFCWSVLAKRLGYDAPWVAGLLMLIPIVNIGLLLFLVLNESPNEKKLRDAASDPEQLGAVSSKETCLRCGSVMPEDMTRCASCGWSFAADEQE